MKTSVENKGPLARRLNVEIPAEIVTGAFNKIYGQIQKEVHIKGFRPGKAPMATVRSLYSDRVKQDVAQELIQHHYTRAVIEHKLNPVNFPEFDFTVPVDNEVFSFSANFEIRPEVQLKNYEGIEVEKEAFSFDEKAVDKVLENIQSSNAEWNALLEDRPAQMGDMAVIDFEGFVDGKPLPQGSGTDFPLELGSRRFIEGYEEGIVGMNIGTQKTLHLKFPEGYQAAELSGKPVEFKVTLKSLKKKSLPEITPEFLKEKMGGSIETVEKLRENIRNDLEKNERSRIETDFKNRLLKNLVKLNPIEVPASLIKEQKESLIQDMKQRMTQQGLPESQFGEYVQKWDSDFEATAKEMIQSGFIIDAIAKKHELNFTDADLDKKYEEYASQTGIELARIKDFYSRPEQSQKLSYMITEEKVMDHLLKTAKVKEVPKDKLKDQST
jgi:trigger factor